MKYQHYYFRNIFTIFAVLIPLVFNIKETEGFLTENTKASPFLEETCINNFGKTVIGIKPYLTSQVDKIENCKQFWYCRVHGLRNNSSTIKTMEAPLPLVALPVGAVKFVCADADPNKPYYDAGKCECVSSKSHCDSEYNWNNQYACTRPYDEDLEMGEPLEDCRAFGQEIYFQNEFVHYDSEIQFWSCSPSSDCSTGVHLDLPTNCSNNNDPNIVWDITSCSCNLTANKDEAYKIRQINRHPMNRFKCAKPFDSSFCKSSCMTPDATVLLYMAISTLLYVFGRK